MRPLWRSEMVVDRFDSILRLYFNYFYLYTLIEKVQYWDSPVNKSREWSVFLCPCAMTDLKKNIHLTSIQFLEKNCLRKISKMNEESSLRINIYFLFYTRAIFRLCPWHVPMLQTPSTETRWNKKHVMDHLQRIKEKKIQKLAKLDF